MDESKGREQRVSAMREVARARREAESEADLDREQRVSVIRERAQARREAESECSEREREAESTL